MPAPLEAPTVIKLLNDIHFLALNNSFEIQLGSDILFWYHYTQSFKQIILKDQYIPALKYRELPPVKSKRKQQANEFEIYPAWEIVSDKYELEIQLSSARGRPVYAKLTRVGFQGADLWYKRIEWLCYNEYIFRVAVIRTGDTAEP